MAKQVFMPSGQLSPFAAVQRRSAAPAGGPVRVAFLGRTSTEDQQDPTISIPRQLRACQAALPSTAVIVVRFYDVESGRKDLHARGQGRGHERFDIPVRRDGGIQDLLDRVDHADRGFDAVICESVDRIARRTYYGVLIEHLLERAGVALMAADEPASIKLEQASRATGILTRRIKQGVAEWYVLDMLAKSWAGFEEHTEQGYNVGIPPYGYLADRIPHPVPARRAEGKTKTRLCPDPQRAPVVAQIFGWRIGERLSYATIAARLNTDPGRYPPAVPTDPRRAVGHWTSSMVRTILANPKYTGYMVWNRRATKRGGKTNPVDEWVCSSAPTHPPIVTVEMFQHAATVRQWRRGSRDAAGPNSQHPNSVGRSYLLRGHVFCAICGRRMFGKTRNRYTYFACEARRDPGPEDHRFSICVQQDALLDGLRQFLATHLFGHQRSALLTEAVERAAADARRSREQASAQLCDQIADLAARQRRLILSLETVGHPQQDFLDSIQLRLAELRTEQHHAEQAQQQLTRDARHDTNPALLDQLPIGDIVLSHPEHILRRLYELSRLEIHYDHRPPLARYRCRPTAETIAQLRALASGHLLPSGWPGADTPTAPGQLVVSGQAVLTTDSACLTHERDLALAAVTVEPELLSRRRCMP